MQLFNNISSLKTVRTWISSPLRDSDCREQFIFNRFLRKISETRTSEISPKYLFNIIFWLFWIHQETFLCSNVLYLCQKSIDRFSLGETRLNVDDSQSSYDSNLQWLSIPISFWQIQSKYLTLYSVKFTDIKDIVRFHCSIDSMRF